MDKNNPEKTIQELSSKIYDFETQYQRLKGLIDNLPGDIYWKDQNYIWIGLNKHCAQSLQKMGFIKNGLEDEVIGKTDFQIFNHTTAEIYRKNDLEVMKKKIEVTREETTYLSTGECVVLLSIKRPLLDKDGNIIGIAGNTIDITERKKIEGDLQKAKNAAESANIAKTEFIANMSHDIRTPLSGVVGLGNLVESEIENPNQKAKVHDMVKSADELLNMLNEILDVVTLGNVTVNDIHEEPFDLPHLIQTIVDLEQSSVDLKQIKLLQSIDKQVPSVLLGDHKKIHHILLNLVSNALKFTQNGQVTINIKLTENPNDFAQLLFEISDTGIGISPELLDKIFELFYKVTPSYKGLDKGYGVGLHIVKTYTELLGGKVFVESKINEGSKFYFTLNLKVADKTAKPVNIIQDSLVEHSGVSPILTESIPTNITPLENAPEVLIVEDNVIALAVAQTLVNQAKCNPTSACDGETALKLVKTKHFDLILSDIGLPGISGIELAQQIRRHEKENNKKAVPIVAITGHAEGKIHDECIAAGINEVFIKPIRPEIVSDVCTNFHLFDNNNHDSSSQLFSPITAPNPGTLKVDLPDTESELFEIEHQLVFDIQNARKILGDNTVLLMKMLKDTINIAIPDELPRLQAAHEIGNWKTVANIAHKLKGGFLSISLNRAATACKYLERYHKTGKTELLEKLYQQVIKTLEITSNSLKSFTK